MRLSFLQTSEPIERYDTLTVVAIVVFVLLVSVLAGLLLRTAAIDSAPEKPNAKLNPNAQASGALIHRGPATPQVHQTMTAIGGGIEDERMPVWLAGTHFGQTASGYAVAASLIHRLLRAATDGDVRSGLALYTPEYLERTRLGLGVDMATFEQLAAIQGVTVGPIPPAIRLIVDVDTSRPMTIEATAEYTTRHSERFRFVQNENGQWLIDDIRRA